jgi:hypothetical protein
MWTRLRTSPYPSGMAAAEKRANDIRRVRVLEAVWEAYGDVVGDIGRAQDIKDYIAWRIDNPRTPLPGKRLGPVVRRRPEKASATEY